MGWNFLAASVLGADKFTDYSYEYLLVQLHQVVFLGPGGGGVGATV